MANANNIAWETYINKMELELDGRSYNVYAENLNKEGKREARLMAYMDSPEHSPKVLKEAGYSLLATSNKGYVLFHGNTFAQVPDCSTLLSYHAKLDFPLFTAGRGTGESEYIDYAFNTGIISNFANSGKLYQTIRGREQTKSFSFLIKGSDLRIDVNGAIIEVDAGYEGEKDILLLEAKVGVRSHFNIKQLYYPFRHFSQLVPNKKVRTLFFIYDLKKASYTLHEFSFRDREIFDSIYAVKCCIYSLVRPYTYLIDELIDKDFSTEGNVVPQADDINKIFELLVLIMSGRNTVHEVAEYFAFDIRQSNYYGEAAESLGLITRHKGVFDLTERGGVFISLEPQHQQSFILKLIINSWYFQKLISKAKQKGFFTTNDVEELIISVEKDDGAKRYSNSTIGRRVQTVFSWSKWISEEFKSFLVEEGKVMLK